MKHELVKWLYIDLGIDMVMGLNLGRPKLSFLLILFLAWMEKGKENPNRQKGVAKGVGKTTNGGPWMAITLLLMLFSF